MSDMAVLSPHQFTVAEYHRMAEHGVLKDARVELLDGLIVEMGPIGPLHWNMHAIINAYLTEALRGAASVIPQGSFPLGKKSEPQPDEPHALGYRRSERLTHGCSFGLARLPNCVLDAAAFLQP